MPQEELVEVAVARLDERLQGFEKAFGQMVEDQRSLVESYKKLVESSQRIALLENDMVTHKRSLEILWQKFDAHVSAHNKAANSIIFELLKLALAVIIGGVAAKYGIAIH